MTTLSSPDAVSPAMAPARHDPLLSPLTIKGITFRNRVMSTSHACGLESGGMPTERYQRYHEEKAKGGIGLTMFGGSSNVDLDSPNIFRQLNVGTDAIIPYLQEFSDRIHQHGTKLMVQITHLGRRGEPYADNWLPTIAPSPIRETLHRSFPREMDLHDIRRVTKAYGAAARRCRDGGLDGIETLAGGHLIGQFLSPKTNHRTDGYGGSLANRCRFALEVLEEIRKQAGNDFLVGMRFIIDEGDPDGIDTAEGIGIAQLIEKSGMLDFFNAIYGKMDTELALAVDNMPGMASPIAPWLAAVGAFKREVTLPVFHAARISDIATARHAIAEGLLDMVAMTRAHIADPHIVRKIEAGQEHLIRPCVGATHCQSPYRPHCLHNPATGRETTLGHEVPSAPHRRKIVVVGGGPAGLEAARVSALRGHSVVLFEAANKLGGQVLLGARATWRKDLVGLIDWRASEIERLGVTVRLGHLAEAEDVLAEAPDAVIIATGGMPDLDWLEGSEHCTSVWDMVSGGISPAGTVIVYDGTGRHPAPQTAELAAMAGRQVSLVSLDAQLAHELTYAERIIWKKRMHELQVPMTFDHEIVGVRREGNRLTATFRNMATRALVERIADQVVIEHGTLPADGIFHALKSQAVNDGVTDLEALIAGTPQPRTLRPEARFELHRVGDAASSRNIHAAVLDSLRLCLAI
ncbi:MAG: N-methylproline demethylase [Rhizobiales bacterium PAR1]|nr:MAG: N-methylproline demethylase [Rhizobiales bacterium PAR1]